MALIGFTVFREKLLDGSKTQTIRRARKRMIHVGERLYLYWRLRTKKCESLGVGRCTCVMRLPYRLFREDEEIAKLDGFESAAEMREWFTYRPKPPMFDARCDLRKIKSNPPRLETLFDIIRWEVI